jgi:hypothetical protein
MKCAGVAIVFFGLLRSAYAAHVPLKSQRQLEPDAAPTVHLIYMVGSKVPSDMEARIKAVGGAIMQHLAILSRVGIIAVTGLSADAASILRSQPDVEAVDLDFASPAEPNSSVSKPERHSVDQQAVGGPAVRRLSPSNPAAADVYNSRQWNMRAIAADKVRTSMRAPSDLRFVLILPLRCAVVALIAHTGRHGLPASSGLIVFE